MVVLDSFTFLRESLLVDWFAEVDPHNALLVLAGLPGLGHDVVEVAAVNFRGFAELCLDDLVDC